MPDASREPKAILIPLKPDLIAGPGQVTDTEAGRTAF